ncbi:NUDIX domain-containing protein [Luteimonas aestuarii]|uniref:NUDIX domain-containing protein n=1 Tax=Luteimonas aestuarii TaxID=453837 RepID=A0A4R5TTT8_9GAMM|nr:NUDIX domain-containing protein [Luteimonas aestuarii]TDK24435.1 NUDIX domain-containing protein [Luteimonas aestuarii]
MHALILPGMDGTGELLREFTTSLTPEFTPGIVAYPQSERLGYSELVDHARTRLPHDRPFLLIAESFSGPIGIRLAAARPSGLQGLVLCATFAASPRAWSRPLHPLLMLPFPKPPTWQLMPFMMGRWSTPAWRLRQQAATSGMPAAVARHQLSEVLRVDVRSHLAQIDCPVLYLQASHDRLVPDACWRAIKARLPDARHARLEGPHFLLQHQPAQAAAIIKSHFASPAAALPAITGRCPGPRADAVDAAHRALNADLEPGGQCDRVPSLPVTNERGEQLLAVEMPPRAGSHGTFDVVLVVAWHDDRLLLVHNRRRGVWELPGGFVDPGEDPETSARRELFEESGQSAEVLASTASFTLARADGTLLRGLVYATTLRQPAAFTANVEIDAIDFWPSDHLPEPLSAIDRDIVQRVM